MSEAPRAASGSPPPRPGPELDASGGGGPVEASGPASGPPAAEGAAGREFQRLVDIMRRLRGPQGCPWDREQTLESLRGFVLEETYEVLDAIDRADHGALRGEIGDLLFEGVFLAQIEADEGRFTVAESLRAVNELSLIHI